MNILVVGGTGFIGRNFAGWATEQGHHVTATYRPDGASHNDFLRWAKAQPRLTPLACDLLKEVPDLSKFKVCLYAAGNANHTRALYDPIMDVKANIIGLLNFLHKFKGRLVFMSSGAVYYGLRGLVSPATPVFPTFPYAISKYASEMYLRSFQERGLLREYLIVRFFYAYGPGEPQRRLIPHLIKAFGHQGLNEFRINGTGKTFMQPMYVSDVVEALGSIVQSSVANQTFDLCGDVPMPLHEVVQRASRFFGKTELQINHGDSDEQPIEFWSSNESARQIFELGSQLTIEEGLARYVAWLELRKQMDAGT